MVFFDLDGTIITRRGEYSVADYEALITLQQHGIIRVAVTGRSLYAVNQVLSTDFPLDWLIFSGGAGIINWRTGEIAGRFLIEQSEAAGAAAFLAGRGQSFFMQKAVPESHAFFYKQTFNAPADFVRRLDHYREFGELWRNGHEEITALLIPLHHEDELPELMAGLPHLSCRRATSPFDHKTPWLEVYARDVHKGSSARWLATYLDKEECESLGVGNDYNDIELLDYTSTSYITADAPEVLRERYLVTPVVEDSGFSVAVADWLARKEVFK